VNIDCQAILLDLDGTLLGNNMDTFLPQYLQRLAAYVSDILPPEQFLEDLLYATDVMLNNDGRTTNEELFGATFYPRVGHSRQELEPVFMRFYADVFPTLQVYTQTKPLARQVVQAAFGRGWDVVIATNPLFPATAIEQRLEWAGVADFPYRLVTTYENSRACKPNLLYFEGIIKTIGRPADRCLMVGDEDMDMVAARLGMATFLVPGPRTQLGPETPTPTFKGTLGDVLDLIALDGTRTNE
jgi:FMN phosphatase YigB (HAD superfamily)